MCPDNAAVERRAVALCPPTLGASASFLLLLLFPIFCPANTQTHTQTQPTQRLLLVSGDLSVLASIDAGCGSVGLVNAITSLLWVGPALLFMTAAGQVRLWCV